MMNYWVLVLSILRSISKCLVWIENRISICTIATRPIISKTLMHLSQIVFALSKPCARIVCYRGISKMQQVHGIITLVSYLFSNLSMCRVCTFFQITFPAFVKSEYWYIADIVASVAFIKSSVSAKTKVYCCKGMLRISDGEMLMCFLRQRTPRFFLFFDYFKVCFYFSIFGIKS